MHTAQLPKAAKPPRAEEKHRGTLAKFAVFYRLVCNTTDIPQVKCLVHMINGRMVLNCAHFDGNISRRLRTIQYQINMPPRRKLRGFSSGPCVEVCILESSVETAFFFLSN